MHFSKEKVEELNKVRDSFYRVMKGLDEVKPDQNGIIRVNNRRVLLIDTETFGIPSEIIGPSQNKIMYELGVEAGEFIGEGIFKKKGVVEKTKLFFKILWNGGFDLLKDVLKVQKSEELGDKIAIGAGYGLYAGWGVAEITQADDEKIIWKAKNSFEFYAKARREGEINESTCHFALGVLTGFSRIASGKENLEGKEEKCQAKGDEYCKHVIQGGDRD